MVPELELPILLSFPRSFFPSFSSLSPSPAMYQLAGRCYISFSDFSPKNFPRLDSELVLAAELSPMVLEQISRKAAFSTPRFSSSVWACGLWDRSGWWINALHPLYRT